MSWQMLLFSHEGLFFDLFLYFCRVNRKKKIILCLGTNVEQQRNMQVAQELLRKIVGDIVFTPSLWTDPINTISPQYLNCMAIGWSVLSYDNLLRKTKAIERNMGRTEEARQAGVVMIDIDIMLYDEHKYHHTDWDRDYVKQLLKLMNDIETQDIVSR